MHESPPTSVPVDPATAPGRLRELARRLAPVVLSCLFVACAGLPPPPRNDAAPKPRANLILVTCDTLRADHLGCYRYFRNTSPTIDAFSSESILFERCVTPVSFTTPSHVSILTAVYPYEHGVMANSLQLNGVLGPSPFLPNEGIRSFAQIAREQGYRTGGFVSAAPLKRVTGVAAGFEEWSEPEGARGDGAETNAKVLAWLTTLGQEPFFLWVHYYEPHGPYAPPEHPPATHSSLYSTDAELLRYLGARRPPSSVDLTPEQAAASAALVNNYDACVRLLDDRVDELFRGLKERHLWDASTIVLTGDHGQGLGQHDDPGHGRIWWEQIHVPLIVKPATTAPATGLTGTRRSDLVSTIDILPTALSVTPGLDGSLLDHQARGLNALGDGFEPRAVFAMVVHQRQFEPGDAIIVGRWKYVRDDKGNEELFDLEEDPFELSTVSADHPDIQVALHRFLATALAEQRERGSLLHAGQQVPVNNDESGRHIAELRALGYADDAEK